MTVLSDSPTGRAVARNACKAGGNPWLIKEGVSKRVSPSRENSIDVEEVADVVWGYRHEKNVACSRLPAQLNFFLAERETARK